MSNITRRRFLKQASMAGAASVIFPGALNADEGVSPVSEGPPLLLVSPYLARPTKSDITVSIVAGKIPADCFISYRKTRTTEWRKTEVFSVESHTPFNINLYPLSSDSSYEYRVHARKKGSDKFKVVSQSNFRTQKADKSSFSFAMISDSHITPNEPERINLLSYISKSILERKPDFLLMLGDNIQTFTSHGGPMTEERYGPILYYMLRSGLGELPASIPVFNVIGNWEGENGWHPENQREWARKARTAWVPPPLPETYHEGGSKFGDYFGFTWGDTLNLVLNVTGYTTIGHVHGSLTGRGDDWTLGKKQKEWLYEKLKNSRAEWKFIYIHHTVAGNAGNDINSRYGRGGGQAAEIGEQKLIHKWMKEFEVNALFYGHDHVFTDIPVDGIHYTCVGSAGAPWKFTEAETGYEKYIPDSGYTWVDVDQNRVSVSFVRSDLSEAENKTLYQYGIK